MLRVARDLQRGHAGVHERFRSAGAGERHDSEPSTWALRWDKRSPMENTYPHLSPELRQLSSEALRLWGDGEARRQALVAVVDAWVAGTAELSRAINHVDAAVAEGLGVLGLPRGPVRQVRIDTMRPGLNGQKLRDCTIVLVGEYLRTFVQVRQQGDPVFRTWLHESLHARQPYAPGASAEYRAFRGYEEGLVEGLTHEMLGGGSNPVAHWAAIFGPDTVPTADAAQYPAFAKVRDQYVRLRNRNLQLLESMTEADLDKPTPWQPKGLEEHFATFGKALLTIAMHQTMHRGQITDAIRSAGRARPAFAGAAA